MTRVVLLLFSLLGLTFPSSNAQEYGMSSPDGNLKAKISVGKELSFSLFSEENLLLENNGMALVLSSEILGLNPKIVEENRSRVEEKIRPVVPLKYSEVSNNYNQLRLDFDRNFSMEFRLFNDGFAYRFVTDKSDSIEVMNENLRIAFPENYLVHLQQTSSFKTSYEAPYSHINSSEFSSSNTDMATLPVLVEARNGVKILVSESDLRDYPAMFLKGDFPNKMAARFPKNPLKFGNDGDRSVKILKTADYIAKTDGRRSFPWRYFVIAQEDGELLENTMTLKLAPDNRIKDTSWIQPGQVSWEWWNGASPYKVDFVSGFNEETYKYFIDFASEFGIPYIIMDEGWAQSTTDPYTPNPDIDLFELIAYGKERNVEIVLWLTWLTVEKNFELFKTFQDWGIAGVKIDFMDRSDQWMVNFYERVAKEAARNKLFIDFHGSFKPAGLEYAYPNILSYEGVLGMEQMGRATPDNSIFLPFMRNAVGPMDYTPGAMISMQPEVYHSERPNSAGVGTRAYQLSLFVIFESGLQMLADNPTNYYRERACTEFITSVPTTWDETVALKAKTGEYVIVAKRKGEKWYIGGMTNSRQDERTFKVAMDFLQPGKDYEMVSFEDGLNSGSQAMDFQKKKVQVNSDSVYMVKMVRNGGWAAVLSEKK